MPSPSDSREQQRENVPSQPPRDGGERAQQQQQQQPQPVIDPRQHKHPDESGPPRHGA